MKKININVCGSFGFGNAGDEAIPLAVNDVLSDLGVDASINVVSRYGKPDQPGVMGMGDEYIDRRSQIAGFPTLVSGGGIVENSNRSTIISCSKFLKQIPSGYLGFVGVSADAGVNYGWLVKNKIRNVLKHSETIYARDVVSEGVIKRIVPSLRVRTIGDLVLWMRPASIAHSKLPKLPEKFVAIVLAPRWSDSTAWRSWIADELMAIQKNLKVSLVFVPMSCRFDDDRIEHKMVIEAMRAKGSSAEIVNIESELSPREVSAVLGTALLTVSMRLHGCVMAYARGRPFVAISYHPKVSAFSQTIRQEQSSIPDNFPKEQTGGFYGYNFESLKLSKGDLLDRVSKGLENFSFFMLEELKSASREAINNLVAKSYPNNVS